MKYTIPTILALGLLVGPRVAHAALTTELFRVTLPYASGVYGAGHVFDITVTYDDAGTGMTSWNDGANGVAEFGSGDDTLKETFDLSDPLYSGFTLFSNAQISISGLAPLPVGATPRDVFSFNVSVYYECCGSTWEMEFAADDLSLYIIEAPGVGDIPYYSYLTLQQYYVTDSGAQGVNSAVVSGDTPFISRSAGPVPEPGTLLLIGSGLIGLVARRRLSS